MIASFRSRQFVAFLVTGGIAALVNFGSRILYDVWTDYSTAIVLAYLTGMVTAFVLAKLFVFTESRQALHHSALYFVLVNVLAVAQTWAISMALVTWVFPALGIRQWAPELAHAAGVIFPVFTSYLGHKRFSFR